MVSFLDGPLRKAIAQGFKGKLQSATLTRQGAGGGLDEYGDPLPSSSASYKCEGFTDGFSAFIRAQAGIADTDSKISIIGESLPRGIVPRAEDRVTVNGKTFNIVRLMSVDPASALYECQASEVFLDI